MKASFVLLNKSEKGMNDMMVFGDAVMVMLFHSLPIFFHLCSSSLHNRVQKQTHPKLLHLTETQC